MNFNRSIAFPVAIMIIIGMIVMMALSTIIMLSFFVLYDKEGKEKNSLELVGKLLQSRQKHTSSGQLVVDANGFSANILAFAGTKSDFWYILSDGNRTVKYGVIPSSAQEALRAVPPQTSSFQFHYSTDAGRYLGLYLPSAINSNGGVALGGVSLTGVQTMLAVLWGLGPQGFYHLLGIVLIATASVAVVAIKRAIASPVRRVVASAEKIDGLPNGRRISDHDTPSELRPMVAAFNVALSRIDGAFEVQRHFLASVSHELRTPLTKLRIKLEQVEDTALRDILIRDAGRLSSVVTTSLQLARLSGQALTFTALDIAAVARMIVAEHVPAAMKVGIDIEFKAPEWRIMVLGSEAAIRVALDNLIINALRHAKGTDLISIEVHEPCILRVTDEGPGIPASERSLMLKPFVRGSNTTADGTGMGLAIVAQIMGAHNGSIELSGAISGGLVVTLSFPKSA